MICIDEIVMIYVPVFLTAARRRSRHSVQLKHQHVKLQELQRPPKVAGNCRKWHVFAISATPRQRSSFMLILSEHGISSQSYFCKFAIDVWVAL